MTTSKLAASVSDSAAKFDRIRRAHQSEVAEDYVEMISDLIEETGEARTVDLAARFKPKRFVCRLKGEAMSPGAKRKQEARKKMKKKVKKAKEEMEDLW